MSDLSRLSQWILERCAALGFANAGIARVEPTRWADELRTWLADGRHGEMGYLERNADLLLDPTRLLADARSMICVADRYASGDPDPASASGDLARPRGRIARYARGDDYHDVIKRRLHGLCDELRERYPDEQFRACVDTAPVLEREYAERAGLGSIGKHTLLIDRGAGSYLLLGEILTTLDLEAGPPASPDPCGSCTRCIDACPTDAITPWSVDATRCISYLTIEHRTAIDPVLAPAMGDWIFGCDICQEVCPHNAPTDRSRGLPVHPAYGKREDGFDLHQLLAWTEDDRRAAFARSALKRAKLGMMKRNGLIAAGNAIAAGDRSGLRERIEAVATDANEDDMVRETARMVLGMASDRPQ